MAKGNLTKGLGQIPGAPSHSEWYLRGQDIWIRSRTNSLAHKIEAGSLRKWSQIGFSLRMVFVILPMICIGLSLSNCSASLIVSPSSGQVSPMTGVTTFKGPERIGGFTNAELGVIAIISNALALLTGILSNEFKWGEKSVQHTSLMTGYASIAQKARKLESSELPDVEAKNLYLQLQDLFETHKSNPPEASHGAFLKAQAILPNLKPLPFDNTESLLPRPSIKKWWRSRIKE